MNSNYLKIFIAVYEGGSIGEASTSLIQSKTNVRTSIIKLEEELKVKLFKRSSKGMIPTTECRKMYSIMKYLQFNIEELERYYSLSKAQSGLRVASNYIEQIAYYFSMIVEEYGDDKSIYTYLTTNSDEVLEMVIKDKSDIGIFCFGEDVKENVKNTCNTYDLYYKTLTITEPAIYVRKDHPLANKDYIIPSDLIGYKRVGLNDAERKIISYVDSMKKRDIDSKADIIVNSVRNIVKLLERTNCYYISIKAIRDKPYMESLKPISIMGLSHKMYVAWCCRKGYLLNVEGTKFLNLVEDYFKGEIE